MTEIYAANQGHPAGPYPKDPDAQKALTFDLTTWLGAADISSVTWIVPADLTSVSESNTTKKASIWLSGGTVPNQYIVTCRVTTNEVPARIDDRSVRLFMTER